MKIKVIILSLISSLMVGGVFAQGVEQDDMYFNAKDRAKLRAAQKSNEVAMASVKKMKKSETEESFLNPTDSYSARNVNPEFTSRSQSQTAQADDEDYFVSNYQYNRTNYNNFNNNYNRWYGNSWYNSNYWAPSIYGFSSPYYGYNNAWSSPWYDPYWSQNGWSSSFSYYYGNSWNYGWGGNYNYWNRPYCGGGGWNSYYGSNYYNSNAYWNYYRNPVVIINNGEAGRNISYGKRPTRGSSIVSENNNGSRSRSGIVTSGTRDGISGGRISNTRTQQTEYYNRSWRNAETNTAPSSYDSRRSTQNNRSSSWGNSNNSTERSTFSTPSRSSSNSTFDSGGSRSHSSPPATSGSGSSGRTRGRD